MSEQITLTQAATAAAQFLGVLDSGEALSPQQLTDALAAANNLLAAWTNEQTEAMAVLIQDQIRDGALFIDQQAKVGGPLAVAYTLAGGVYTAGNYTAPTFVPAGVPQFADTTTAINVPNGYSRALKLNLAIEIAPQYDVQPSAALVKQAAEALRDATVMPKSAPVPGRPDTQTSPEPTAGA